VLAKPRRLSQLQYVHSTPAADARESSSSTAQTLPLTGPTYLNTTKATNQLAARGDPAARMAPHKHVCPELRHTTEIDIDIDINLRSRFHGLPDESRGGVTNIAQRTITTNTTGSTRYLIRARRDAMSVHCGANHDKLSRLTPISSTSLLSTADTPHSCTTTTVTLSHARPDPNTQPPTTHASKRKSNLPEKHKTPMDKHKPGGSSGQDHQPPPQRHLEVDTT